MMKMLVVSDTFIVKDAILKLFIRNFITIKAEAVKYLNEIKKDTLSKYDIIFLQINTNKIDELEQITNTKETKNDIKIILIDPSKNEKICIKAIKMGVDGYITSLDNEEEFIYITKKIISGGKFYDGHTVQKAFRNNSQKVKYILTNRERDVMKLVCKGMSNKEIANKLVITEYTVKKHISSMLDKLNVKNRQDVIIHFQDKNVDNY